MAEKIVSPGVFTKEVDQSFLPAEIAAIGAALIGPTVKGPAGIPTIVSSYSEYQQIFGDTFTSGSGVSEQSYAYLSSYAAKEYLRHADTLTVVRVLAGAYRPAQATISSSNDTPVPCFTLSTINDGAILNSNGPTGSNGIFLSGSKDNFKWEITSTNVSKGTFNMLIRRGDDTDKRKLIIEQFNNLTLDPNSNNYIAKVIGDQNVTLRDSGGTDPFLQMSGSFINKSKYIRVTTHVSTYNYLDSNGNIRDANLSSSLPIVSSGSFQGGSDGNVQHPIQFYNEISNTNTQGFNLSSDATGKTAYEDAINILSNQDEYDINLVMLPGLVDNNSHHAAIITKAIDMCEGRGDCFALVDPTSYGSTIAQSTTQAEGRDSNYAAMYWPWVQLPDNDLGKNVWVPPSVVIPGVYAFNDRVAAEWFAPAGLNRGGIESAIMAERKLTHTNRDTLYESNVNPIATFPNTGICVWGQKTLQKKASALDRVNVRRLLISLKSYISQVALNLVFEQNTAATRNNFLAQVNPYLESVQQRQGLYAFRVIMNESNNTADVIDRNELVGAIYLQPTKTAEFIYLDFNVTPTGAVFPS